MQSFRPLTPHDCDAPFLRVEPEAEAPPAFAHLRQALLQWFPECCRVHLANSVPALSPNAFRRMAEEGDAQSQTLRAKRTHDRTRLSLRVVHRGERVKEPTHRSKAGW